MARLARLAAVWSVVTCIGGCGYGEVFNSWLDHSAGQGAPTGPKLPGHLYMLRGLAGDIYSLGLDQLADKITRRGVTATVHGITESMFLADEIIRKYKSDEDRGPIMLLGHSSGGDLILSMAQRMRAADVPVALAFGFDPTRISGDVPSNVELFINLYQRFNPIGGGEATPGPSFRGRLINVDLRDHSEIVHITLDKSPVIHEVVAKKVLAVAAFAARQASPSTRKKTAASLPGEVRPLVLKYVVPRDQPIVLWDSAFKATVKPGETLETIVSKYGAPAWAIAQINNINEDRPVEPGRTLLIPHSIYTDTSPPPVPTPVAASRARPPARVSQSTAPPAVRPAAVRAASDQPPPRANSFNDRWGFGDAK